MNNIVKDTKKLSRSFTLQRENVNSDDRTVTLAFSSETPYERSFGIEILDHDAKSIRLGRLLDGGPLLLNHDDGRQIGVVESVENGSDRVLRAKVRFGKSKEADEIFNDVVDGIRRKVSVGYIIHNMILDTKEKGAETYRVIDWEPLEISIVSIPADNSVGVGRSHDESTIIEPPKEEKMTDKTEQLAPTAPAVDVKAIEAATRSKELARINDMEAIGQKFVQFGGVELARKFMAEGKTIDDLNKAILDRAIEKKPAPTGEIGLSEREIKQYSFVRVLNALANPRDRVAQEAAAYEIEASTAAADKAGKAARGIMVPVDVLRSSMKRDLSVGTSTAGGHTVATDLLAGSFIDVLRNRLAIADLGATILNGLVGNIAIPRQTSGATAYWVAESGAPTESQQAVDQVTLSPKTVGAYTDYSRRLLLQSSIDVENMVRTDLAKVIALAIDSKALYGDGTSNTPTGLKNISGLNTVNLNAATPTFAEVVSMETLVAADNADVGSMAYLTNATLRGALKSALVTATYGDRMIWGSDNTLNGYRALASNQVASGDLFFGNFSDLILGFWSGLDLMSDPYAGATTGTVRIIALQDTDVAARHAESFCRANDNL